MKVSPPLRKEEDRKALIQGVKDGSIDVIVSDHKPEDEEVKDFRLLKLLKDQLE